MITALVFDCFGVLYQGSRTYLYDLVPAEQHAELADLNQASDYGYIEYDAYTAQASELAGVSVAELEQVFQSEHRRNDKLISFIRSSKNSYKIGLLSNVGPKVMERLFSADEQAELFDAVVLSCDVSNVKPHPEMYETILQKLDVQAENAVMIDDIQDNITGAQAVGMHGVQFVSTTQTIDDLRQLLERA